MNQDKTEFIVLTLWSTFVLIVVDIWYSILFMNLFLFLPFFLLNDPSSLWLQALVLLWWAGVILMFYSIASFVLFFFYLLARALLEKVEKDSPLDPRIRYFIYFIVTYVIFGWIFYSFVTNYQQLHNINVNKFALLTFDYFSVMILDWGYNKFWKKDKLKKS